MKKFFLSLLLFFGFTSLLTICISLYFINKYQLNSDNIPPINFSSSISFNEKMDFLHKSKIKPTVISLGSSTSLNNLDSRIIEKHYNAKTLNTASWGMNMGDNFQTLKILSSIYPIKTIVMSSNYGDFVNKEKYVKIDQLSHYLKHDDITFLTFIETFNLKYFLDNYKLIKIYRTVNGYGSLHFNQYGDVNIDSSNLVIIQKRWNTTYLNQPSIKEQYAFLDSISVLCKNKNIDLVFFEAPYRKGLYTTLSENDMQILNTHKSKVDLILKKYNHIYINSLDTTWNDNLFIDGIHLNAAGAKIYTSYCSEKLNQLQKSN
jgi:hypothetical protein